MSDQRTEAPTPRRLEETRRRGDPVGRSHEFIMAATLGMSVAALSSLVPDAARSLALSLRGAVVAIGEKATPETALVTRLGEGVSQALGIVLPLGLAVGVVGVATNLAAGGFVVSIRAVRFDPSRMNPAKGIRRLVDKGMFVRLALAVAKLAVLAWACWQILGARILELVTARGASVGTIAADALSALFGLGLSLTILLGALALVDFIVQRRRALGALRMSRDDIRREHKESEGDPLVRGQRRRRARQLAFARMMDAVATADVVVVNPTEIAIALRYDSLSMTAPRIVAKGHRLMAARIREIAGQHGVPVLEDRPLARALYGRPLGSEVPPHLYKAVARILVLVHHARFSVRHSARGGQRQAPVRATASTSRGGPSTPSTLDDHR